jgi:hypothetical protein
MQPADGFAVCSRALRAGIHVMAITKNTNLRNFIYSTGAVDSE